MYGFQDAASPILEEFLNFHDYVILILIFILRVVGASIISMLINKLINTSLLEGQALEYFWTILPALILIQIAIPSLILLYMLDETIECSLTLKVVGHQWYWSYEYSNFWNNKFELLEFDSYISPANLNTPPRLLEVDNRVILPYIINIRILLTAADVLHCWTVPSIGVKADAVPGRLNQIKFISYRPSIFYGQCSEICGANHRFMPIVLEFVKLNDFLNWVRLWE